MPKSEVERSGAGQGQRHHEIYASWDAGSALLAAGNPASRAAGAGGVLNSFVACGLERCANGVDETDHPRRGSGLRE